MRKTLPPKAASVIKHYDLKPLEPEGGWFNRFWYRKGKISQIYYLLAGHEFSEFHILPHEEQIMFLAGDSVEHFRGTLEEGKLTKVILGDDFTGGEVRNLLVGAQHCQAMRLVQGGNWALMSTIMSPPFEFEDYLSLGCREMTKAFPTQSDLIKELTRF